MTKRDPISRLSPHAAYLAVLLIVAGFAWRFLWLTQRGINAAGGEARNVALSLAQTGAIADAYELGHGIPSAHILPVPTLVAATVYRLFGTGEAGETVLALIAIGLVSAALWFLYRAFVRLGLSLPVALATLAVAALFPLDFQSQTVAFRVWDGGYAVLFSALFLFLLAGRQQARRPIELAPCWIVAAVLFFVSPQLGLGAFVALLLFGLFRLSWSDNAKSMAIGAAALACVLAPWTIRNAATFGSFTPLRSNFGLELALAFYDGADEGRSEQKVMARLAAIHPHQSPATFRRFLAVGSEAAYARPLGRAALAWIAAHPAKAAKLAGLHLKELLFPSLWQWRVYSEGQPSDRYKMLAQWLLSLLGLCGMAAAAVRGPPVLRLAAVMLGSAMLTYVMVEPILRYRSAFIPLLTFFSGVFAQLVIDTALGLVGRRPAMKT